MEVNNGLKVGNGLGNFCVRWKPAFANEPENKMRTYLVQRLTVARDGVINLLLPFIQVFLQTLDLRRESLESLGRCTPRLNFLPLAPQGGKERIEGLVNWGRLRFTIRCELPKFRELLQCPIHPAFVVDRSRPSCETETGEWLQRGSRALICQAESDREVTCVQTRLQLLFPGKMPRFITGDELGNLKAYVSATESDSAQVRCSELLVETDKRKSVQMLATARSTVGNIRIVYVETY